MSKSLLGKLNAKKKALKRRQEWYAEIQKRSQESQESPLEETSSAEYIVAKDTVFRDPTPEEVAHLEEIRNKYYNDELSDPVPEKGKCRFIERKLISESKYVDLYEGVWCLVHDIRIDENGQEHSCNENAKRYREWCKKDSDYVVASSRDYKFASFIIKHGINPEPSPRLKNTFYHICNMGFSEDEQTWYAWGRRGIAKFKIGDVITKRNIAYSEKDLDTIYNGMCARFHIDNNTGESTHVKIVKTDTDVRVYSKEQIVVGITLDDKQLIMQHKEFERMIIPPGKGEFTITTLEEAKECAIEALSNL